MKRLTTTTKRPVEKTQRRRGRRGFLAPLVAFALLAAMAATALVLDTLWLQGARVELERCAEAAAWSAAESLVNDDLLRRSGLSNEQKARAVWTACQTVQLNPVVGSPVQLVPGDVVIQPQQGRTFTVVVTAHRTRTRNNPVAMLLRTRGGPEAGDVVAQARVFVDNRIQGFAAEPKAFLPLLPLAILETTALKTNTHTFACSRAAKGRQPQTRAHTQTFVSWTRTQPLRGQQELRKRQVFREERPLRKQQACRKEQPLLEQRALETWNEFIEWRQGPDQYGFDAELGRVVQRPDGLPEMTLKLTADCGSNSETADFDSNLWNTENAKLLDLGAGCRTDRLVRQICRGLSAEDLSRWNGLLLIDRRSGLRVPTGVWPTYAEDRLAGAFRRLVGQVRVCLLFRPVESSTAAVGTADNDLAVQKPWDDGRGGFVWCSRFVAVRILNVEQTEAGVQIVVQPAVLLSSSAVVAAGVERTHVPLNPYVYKAVVLR